MTSSIYIKRVSKVVIVHYRDLIVYLYYTQLVYIFDKQATSTVIYINLLSTQISQLTYFEVESKAVSFTPLCELFNNVLACLACVNVISLVGLSRDGSGGRGR